MQTINKRIGDEGDGKLVNSLIDEITIYCDASVERYSNSFEDT
jgi:hypothetical protein